MLRDTISEGEHTDPKSIVQQIANSIKTLYYRRFRDAAANECDDVVTYNPITRRVIFKNLVRRIYLITAPTNAPLFQCSVTVLAPLKYGHQANEILIYFRWRQKIVRLQLFEPVIRSSD